MIVAYRITLEASIIGGINRTIIFCLNSSICITLVERIDRSNHITNVEHVSRTTPCINIERWILGIYMCKAHISCQLQPLFRLIIYVYTSSVTLVARVFNSTTIIQVTSTCIIVQTITGTRNRKIIFLTERVVNGLIIPIISSIIVISIYTSQCSIWIHLKVSSNQLLSSRYSVYISLLTNTTLVLVEQCGISISISLSLCRAVIILGVELSSIHCLQILSTIVYDIILRN